MKGRRIDLKSDQIHTMQPGDYGRDEDGLWYCHPPKEGVGPGCLGNGVSHHNVIEHEDGTITVSPSILISTGPLTWHGFLKNGEWREC